MLLEVSSAIRALLVNISPARVKPTVSTALVDFSNLLKDKLNAYLVTAVNPPTATSQDSLVVFLAALVSTQFVQAWVP
jgi:hypothetical protein